MGGVHVRLQLDRERKTSFNPWKYWNVSKTLCGRHPDLSFFSITAQGGGGSPEPMPEIYDALDGDEQTDIHFSQDRCSWLIRYLI